ncbi:MAG: PepSY-associated TM helix domain-containing protein [Bacillota bacterium]|nr:PepSY-associated TM helix domain-containing protein [Bacillota bacterium]
MKKVRRAHLWIGLIASVFLFVEAFTGLILNEPWLVGQSQANAFESGQGFGARGNFQPGQFNQNQGNQGSNSTDLGQGNSNNFQGQGGFRGNRQFGGANGNYRNGNFAGFRGNQNSFMGIIRQLHQGRIGNTNIKWIMDLAAIALMFLTGSGIYLSIKVLRAEKKAKNHKLEDKKE